MLTEFVSKIRSVISSSIDGKNMEKTDALAAVREAAETLPVLISDAGRAAVVLAAANAEWNKGVVEPTATKANGATTIDSYIRGPQGLYWNDVAPYVRNSQFAWCGAFAAFCYGAAGLKLKYRKYYMPSTYRLVYGHAKYGHWTKGTARVIPLDKIEPGDIVIIGKKDGKSQGTHITLAEKVNKDFVETIEGNATGIGPNGKTYEGVIKQKRYFKGNGYVIMHAFRPLPEDFE